MPIDTDIVDPQEAKLQEDLFDYKISESRAKKIINAWDSKIGIRAKENRNIRKIDIDLDQLHMECKLKVDETIIPIRVVDTNIRQEIPPFISYVRQSRRLAIFKSLDNPQQNTAILEEDFTTGMKYLGWESWIRKVLDGGSLHGWESCEVIFDETKPLHVSVVPICNEDLIFSLDARDVNTQQEIFIRYHITISKLRDYIKYGFDPDYTNKIIEQNKDKNKNIVIFKRYCKFNGIIYVSWFSLECGEGWLKDLEPLYRGRDKQVQTTETQVIPNFDSMGQQISSTTQQVPTTSWEPIYETDYPIHLYRYSESEDPALVETCGRAFFDAPVQEAETAFYSVTVNGAARASNVYASPSQPQGTGGKPVKLDLTLEGGCFYSEPMSFWHTEYPPMDLIRAAQALDTRKQVETGKVAFAAINNPDSRKTAHEIEAAQQQSNQLNSVQITDFSTFLRSVFSDCWLIVQAQAIRGQIKLCYNVESGQNDLEIISQTYLVLPAGDTDVIERAEKLQAKKEFWPIVANTPLAQVFLLDMIKEEFPEDATRYATILQQNDPKKQFITALVPVLTALSSDQELNPDKHKEFQTLTQQATQLLQMP